MYLCSRKYLLCFFYLLTSIAFFPLQAKPAKPELPKKKKYYLSICAIFRDEARFLKEWIEFHRLVGVEHFYLLNNLSGDHYQQVLAPYIRKNIVELHAWNHETTAPGRWSPIQTSGYQEMIKKSAEETEWLAILDTDEFLFPVEENNLKILLKQYHAFAALGVNWQMFGTSGVARVPSDALLIETLTLKAPKDYPENFHIKSIVRPSQVLSCPNPHFCIFKPGCLQVTEHKIPFEGPFSPTVSIEKIRINHYWARDEQFLYEQKIPRRARWGENDGGCLDRNNNLNVEHDFAIFRFIEALKCRITDKVRG